MSWAYRREWVNARLTHCFLRIKDKEILAGVGEELDQKETSTQALKMVKPLDT